VNVERTVSVVNCVIVVSKRFVFVIVDVTLDVTVSVKTSVFTMESVDVRIT